MSLLMLWIIALTKKCLKVKQNQCFWLIKNTCKAMHKCHLIRSGTDIEIIFMFPLFFYCTIIVQKQKFHWEEFIFIWVQKNPYFTNQWGKMPDKAETIIYGMFFSDLQLHFYICSRHTYSNSMIGKGKQNDG